ncbi:MAG: DEAD/DEAH box helicase [Alphaproteobacteria bacterium]|nr:DEAD/DEAH box helicase [Alphaproteobacteria bacterium]
MSDAQQEAIEKLSKLKVGALFMEMGTGKTKVALDLINSKKHKVDYVLWVCPFSLKSEIEAEKEKWHPELDIEIVGCESIGSSDRIYLNLLNKVNGKRVFIVVDESLKIKNIAAKRTQRILNLGELATYKLILNGTPISKNILDLWTQMDFLSPKILNMSYLEYKNTYCEYYVRGKLKGMVKRQVNIPHLISLISPYIYESKLSLDVEQRHSTVCYDVDSYTAYQEYKNEIFDKYYDPHEDNLNFNAFSMKLQRYYCKSSNRQKAIENLIEQIDEKVIVFVRFIESIPEDAHKITGSEKQVQRKEIIKAFKSGKFNVLYITYGCGAYGLNLQFCHNIIFAEQVWDYALQVQAEARIFRLGQSEEVHYYHMICDSIGLEKLISECLSKKTGLLTTIKKEIEKTKGGIKEWVKSL